MTPREAVQERCYRALCDSQEWTAPYGIGTGMRPYGRGMVRTVTFGVARSLDAELLIIAPGKLELRAEGPLAHACPTRFDSCDAFIRWAADPWHIGDTARKPMTIGSGEEEREHGATPPRPGEVQRRCWTSTPTPGGKSAQCRLFNGHEEEEHYFGPPAEVDQAHLGECLACGEESPRGECPASKRPCGHHCNCSWTQDACCWCGATFSDSDEEKEPAACHSKALQVGPALEHGGALDYHDGKPLGDGAWSEEDEP